MIQKYDLVLTKPKNKTYFCNKSLNTLMQEGAMLKRGSFIKIED
ncbi:MAG: hypothetical protein RLZZ292_530 [Bacteroidota bacterium]|jgi:hypothetical protein